MNGTTARAHLLTHPHSNYPFSVLCDTASVHAPHLDLSCRSVRVEWSLQRPFITAQGSCHGLWQSGLDGNWWARRVQGEVRGGFMGLNERIINLSRSATPVSKQRHWSRNIGLHLPATTLLSPLSCLALTFPLMQAKEGIKTGWKKLTFSFILLLGHPFPLLSLRQNCWCRFMAKREGKERKRKELQGKFKPALIQIKLAWYGSVERFQGQCIQRACLCQMQHYRFCQRGLYNFIQQDCFFFINTCRQMLVVSRADSCRDCINL